MALFVGRYVNRIDKKGRVSVPKPFREALGSQSFSGLYVYPLFKFNAFEACDEDFMGRLSDSLEDLPMFSDEQDDLSVILESTHRLLFDPEGRVALPKDVLKTTGITGHALFVGRGRRFQIWEPKTYEANRGKAFERARARGATLQLRRPQDPDKGEAEAMTGFIPHTPVMLNEVMEVLSPRDGAIYVDATFGAGGYAEALLEAADCTVWGIDRDPEAQSIGADLESRFRGRLTVLNGRFGDMVRLLTDVGVERIDGIALDLGVSSMQLDDPERGFSFRADGPLDMRMASSGMTAAEAVNRLTEKELADIIYRYGEERRSRRIARAIVETRRETPITRTGKLAELVRRVVARSKDGIDPATRTFQALRIYVNDEMGELERGLNAAEILLRPGGRLTVVSFHSLEDRQVKEFLRGRSGAAAKPSRHLPPKAAETAPTFKLPRRRVVKPTAAETEANSRARSARMRAAERTETPARQAA